MGKAIYRKKKTSKGRKFFGFFFFLTSIILLPIVYSITYYINRKEKYSFKEFNKLYVAALKDMLKGTWSY